MKQTAEETKPKKASEVLDGYLQDMGGLSDAQYHYVKLAMEEYANQAADAGQGVSIPVSDALGWMIEFAKMYHKKRSEGGYTDISNDAAEFFHDKLSKPTGQGVAEENNIQWCKGYERATAQWSVRYEALQAEFRSLVSKIGNLTEENNRLESELEGKLKPSPATPVDGEISIWLQSAIKYLSQVEGEVVKVSDYAGGLSLKFKSGNYYTLNITKQSVVTLD